MMKIKKVEGIDDNFGGANFIDIDFDIGVIELAYTIKQIYSECPNISRLLIDFDNCGIIFETSD